MKRTKLQEIRTLTAGQWGIITSSQAAQVDVDARTLARLATNGELERVAHGIYRLSGVPAHPLDDLRVAWLSLNPRHTASERLTSGRIEVVSHRSAAFVHQLGDLDSDDLEFTVEVRHQSRRPGIRIHRGIFTEDDWQIAGGLPVTTPLRTIDDLAWASIDQGHLADIVRDAVAQHGLPVSRVAGVLSTHALAYGGPAGDGEQFASRLLNQAGVPLTALEMSTNADAETLASMLMRLDSQNVDDQRRSKQVKSLAELISFLRSSPEARHAAFLLLELVTTGVLGHARSPHRG